MPAKATSITTFDVEWFDLVLGSMARHGVTRLAFGALEIVRGGEAQPSPAPQELPGSTPVPTPAAVTGTIEEVGYVEPICACSHPLLQHSEAGCLVSNCPVELCLQTPVEPA